MQRGQNRRVVCLVGDIAINNLATLQGGSAARPRDGEGAAAYPAGLSRWLSLSSFCPLMSHDHSSTESHGFTPHLDLLANSSNWNFLASMVKDVNKGRHKCMEYCKQ
jgi:hypothetical protein